MEYVEAEGNTIDEAIENALKILGVERDKVTVDILAERKRGILGIGAKKARVRASVRRVLFVDKEEGREEQRPALQEKISQEEIAAVGQKGKQALAEILRLMGINASIEMKPGETEEEIILDIQGESGGLLIGHRGQTLEALQYLLTRIISDRQGREEPQVVLDAEKYGERRRKSLEDMALRLGEKAKRQRKTVTVDAMSAADRRIVQRVLQDDPWVTTKSLGRGAYRRLLIIPEGDRKKRDDEKGQPPEKQGAKGPR
ncbi:KH domain-containing protein [bacterium]|nr:MAG: KH domain-containing protein [bacterium]